jgi:hypothetical protein
MSQLIAISVARMHVGLARRFAVDPGRWRRNFASRDYRSNLFRAMEVESVAGLRHLPMGESRWDQASRADYLDLRRTFLVDLQNMPVSDGPPIYDCSSDLKERQPLSAGGILADLALPNQANAIKRADRLTIDTELTDRVLQARLLRTNLGHWPPEIPGVSASRLSDGHWIYTVSPDGRLTITFSKELHWQDQKGLILPLRYESM